MAKSTEAGPGDEQEFAAIYQELRRIASAILRGSGPNTHLNPTALVHEAYLKLASSEQFSSESALHLKRTIARIMRQILIDSVRHKRSVKAGGGVVKISLDKDVTQRSWSVEDLVVVGDLIEKLRVLQPRQADVVECRFYLGLTDSETATALGVSTATVERDWTIARAWLNGQME